MNRLPPNWRQMFIDIVRMQVLGGRRMIVRDAGGYILQRDGAGKEDFIKIVFTPQVDPWQLI